MKNNKCLYVLLASAICVAFSQAALAISSEEIFFQNKSEYNLQFSVNNLKVRDLPARGNASETLYTPQANIVFTQIGLPRSKMQKVDSRTPLTFDTKKFEKHTPAASLEAEIKAEGRTFTVKANVKIDPNWNADVGTGEKMFLLTIVDVEQKR